MRFTEGVKDFEVTSNKFYIGLRYNVSTATHLWPDGTANSLTTNWLPGQPATDQCVVQYSGQSPKHGQWESMDCTRGSPFICESGHSADPDLGTGGLHEVSFRSYLKTDSAMLNTYDAAQAAQVSYFRHEISDFVIHKGFKEEPVEVCALRCMSDSLCLGMTYTHNTSPHSSFDFCVLLKN
ncbi:uncharacterized protein LOC124280976 [Haliotis rubra]|uniref:uncharacterized protein LOC124280976 n=1 Tax=Haliotis rubra TaxID=36100 RepID=UPI001EE4F956|nr:uncharacterized protein LOC124280976 [Haliotis rubra]